MCGAVPARSPRGAGAALRGTLLAQLFFEFFAFVVTLGEAKHDYFSQCNAGANVAQARVWLSVGELCVAGVGHCTSFKVRKRASPCVFTKNLRAARSRRGCSAVSARCRRSAAWQAGHGFSWKLLGA